MKPHPAIAGLLMLAVLIGGCSVAPLFEDPSKTPPRLFTDIPMPPELEINEGDTIIYDGQGGRVGRLIAKGRVGQVALINYFRENMRREGWAPEGEFDAEKSYIMIFAKKPRAAAINIGEGWVYTDVEVNVSAKRE
jgi:hypothetical protein